ncbi:PREDICTED: uncharacterized protein LOC105114614 isoform X1 [Populus euphratica]|uniref:Uncharacterized protein LOC105114614 isoform X1 n=1 Tax=Populus euphratica TaxID=75702 RepID=A0AAJ6TEM8_POPEU|nr:PREDICTED: uncharacterized protein LOC105114614 isoform X1 [Populus euphratica]
MNGLKSNQIGSSSLKIRQHWPYDLISILSVKISQLMQAYLENNTNNKRRNNDTVGARSLTIIGNRGRRARCCNFEMEESSGSFSDVSNAKRSTVCLHDAEIKITNGKCSIRGQVVFLPAKCPTGISLCSFSEQDGVKRTDFIIPREVPVNEVSLKMDVATLPAAAAATSCAADLHPHTTKGPSKKNY